MHLSYTPPEVLATVCILKVKRALGLMLPWNG
jgi:hypothetical protein